MKVAPKTGASGYSSLDPTTEVMMRGSFNDLVYAQNGRTLVKEICSVSKRSSSWSESDSTRRISSPASLGRR